MRKLREEKGAALLTVLVALMIISIMLFEFQHSSLVERKIAYNDLNQLQASYLAKSAARIGLLRLVLYGKLKKNKDLQNLSQNFNIGPYLDKIWELPLPAFPPDPATLAKLGKVDKDAAEKTLEQTKIVEGKSTHLIRSESSKINLNFLQVPKDQMNERVDLRSPPKYLYQYTALLLLNLLDSFIKQSERPYEEYKDLRPEELVLDIMDWVSPGDTRLAGGSKDTFYEQQRPPYRAKRGRFYTLDELRMVKGIDEHLFQKLKPHVTVYSYDGRINLNSASSQVYLALYKDFTEDDLKRILEERERQGGWGSEKDFVTFVNDKLGRTEFKRVYADENNYPFTVSNQSFVIEASGNITKSASSIQKLIKVGVVLTKAKGGTSLGKIDPGVCNANPNTFYDKRNGACVTKPTNSSECVNIAGTWMEFQGKYICRINAYPPEPAVNIEPPAKVGPGGQKLLDDANSLRILYWSEG